MSHSWGRMDEIDDTIHRCIWCGKAGTKCCATCPSRKIIKRRAAAIRRMRQQEHTRAIREAKRRKKRKTDQE